MASANKRKSPQVSWVAKRLLTSTPDRYRPSVAGATQDAFSELPPEAASDTDPSLLESARPMQYCGQVHGRFEDWLPKPLPLTGENLALLAMTLEERQRQRPHNLLEGILNKAHINSYTQICRSSRQERYPPTTFLDGAGEPRGNRGTAWPASQIGLPVGVNVQALPESH